MVMRRSTLFLILLAGCGKGKDEPSDLASLDDLQDPKFCQECHPVHYEQWAGSMHAYAAADPVFRAMNERGQRETNGELGSFCIQCHAPLAVELGLTTDGLNIDEVPEKYHGVTCYFCHQVEAVRGTHNNPLVLAMDKVMRGGISDPTPGSPHQSAYSELLDRSRPESAQLCGSCHDIVNPMGTHIERTFSEWQESLYARNAHFKLTCSECHMRGTDGVAAEFDGVPLRRVHDHSMPGVDLALTDWPGIEHQRALVQDELDTTLLANLCVNSSGGTTVLSVTVENVAAGHSWPSGASADRRGWVEIIAYDQDNQVAWSTGVVADDQPVVSLDDPYLWLFRDTHYDVNGNESHMFWEAARVDSNLLRAPITADPNHPDFVPTHDNRIFSFGGFEPSRVTMRVRLRPIGLDILDDLIGTGDLDPAFREVMPTFDLGTTVLEWTPESPINSGDFACVPRPP